MVLVSKLFKPVIDLNGSAVTRCVHRPYCGTQTVLLPGPDITKSSASYQTVHSPHIDKRRRRQQRAKEVAKDGRRGGMTGYNRNFLKAPKHLRKSRLYLEHPNMTSTTSEKDYAIFFEALKELGEVNDMFEQMEYHVIVAPVVRLLPVTIDNMTLDATEEKVANLLLKNRYEKHRNIIYGMYSNYQTKRVTIDVLTHDYHDLKQELQVDHELSPIEFSLVEFSVVHPPTEIKLYEKEHQPEVGTHLTLTEYQDFPQPESIDLSELIDRGSAIWTIKNEETGQAENIGSFGYLARDKTSPDDWYLLTSAHVVIPASHNTKGIQNAFESHEKAYFEYDRDIFCAKKVHNEIRKLICKQIKALYGCYTIKNAENLMNDVVAEVDIAVMRIEPDVKQAFVDGLYDEFGERLQTSLDMSQLQSFIEINQRRVEKTGHITGKTFGNLRTLQYRHLKYNDKWSTKILLEEFPEGSKTRAQPNDNLQQQYGSAFAEKGDSGALILHAPDQNNSPERIAVGLLWEKREVTSGSVQYFATNLKHCLAAIKQRFGLELEMLG